MATFATSGPSLVIGTIFTPPFGKERESRPKLVCDGRFRGGPTERGALGISTADRVIEIPDGAQGLEQGGNDTACFPATAMQLQGSTGIGSVALMRSIIMKVFLNVDYNRFEMSIEDAAKVMALLGNGRSVSAKYDAEANASHFQYDKTSARVSIEEIREPIRNAA